MQVGDISTVDLPAQWSEFDAVYMRSVVYHWDNKEAGMRRLSALLKPVGGNACAEMLTLVQTIPVRLQVLFQSLLKHIWGHDEIK